VTGATGRTGATGAAGPDGIDGANSARYLFQGVQAVTGLMAVPESPYFLYYSLTSSFAVGSTAVFNFSAADANGIDRTTWWNALYNSPTAGVTGAIISIGGLSTDAVFATYQLTSWAGISGASGPAGGTIFNASCLAGSGSATAENTYSISVQYPWWKA
jgi:hypothetical protein